MSIEFDFSDLTRLAADLNAVDRRTAPFVRKAVEVSARNVKDNARALAASAFGSHGRRYPYMMQYEMKANRDQVWAEVGPRDTGQGKLAPIFENEGGVPGATPTLKPALAATQDDFVRGLQQAIEDGLNA